MTADRLRLRPLRAEDEAAVRAAQVAMAPDDFLFAFDLTPEADWPAYLADVERLRAGAEMPADRVPATFLLAHVDGEIVGRTSIRHRLNDWLVAFGGHIGYGVLPSFRRRGYATEILRQSLVLVRGVGVDRVLVTCDDDNVGSAAVIESCGGRLDAAWPRTDDERPKRRYWVD